jgi:ankyrin repeat protein
MPNTLSGQLRQFNMRNIFILILLALMLSGCTNYTDDQFFTAIAQGDEKTVQAIINQRDMTKARIGVRYHFDKSNFKIEILPIEENTKISRKDNGWSGLWLALHLDKAEIVEILLQQDFDLLETHEIDEDTSLSLPELALSKKTCNSRIIKRLTQKGVDFNKMLPSSNGPLIIRAVSSFFNWDCVYVLIDAGADPHTVGPHGDGLLAYAALAEPGEVDIEYLIKKMGSFDTDSSDSGLAFIFAIQKGNVNLAKFLLNKGLNKCHSRKGKYLRDFALEYKQAEIADLLPKKAECELLAKKDIVAIK